MQKGIKGSFYPKDPSQNGQTPICVTATTISLQPGQCQTVSCDWNNPPASHANLWFRANDDGQSVSPEECKPKNDLLYLPDARCRNIQ